jgi:hypothetical protein
MSRKTLFNRYPIAGGTTPIRPVASSQTDLTHKESKSGDQSTKTSLKAARHEDLDDLQVATHSDSKAIGCARVGCIHECLPPETRGRQSPQSVRHWKPLYSRYIPRQIESSSQSPVFRILQGVS